jgi:diguanylate cyclase (GGDEF)-like protein/PAS domain S-box-containing protein
MGYDLSAIKITRSERTIAFALLAAGLSVAVIGLLDLLGRVLDFPIFTTWNPGSRQMAPSTAILLILFGATLCLEAWLPRGRATLLLITLSGLIGFMASLLLLALRFSAVYLPAELLGLHISGTFGNAPRGFPSPITDFCLLLSYGSFLALRLNGASGYWRGAILLGSGGLVSLLSFVFLVIYVFDIPLLSGKAMISPAFNTSFCLLIIGLSQLVRAAGDAGRSTASFDAEAVRLLPYVLVFIALCAGTSLASYYFYRWTEQRFRQKVESELLTISELKTVELVRWRMERLWDAKLIQNELMTAAVRRLLATPYSSSAQRDMQDLSGRYPRHIGYDRVILLDAKGVTRMSVPYTPESTDAILVAHAIDSLRTGQTMLQDFYRDKYDQRVYLALIVPVFDLHEGYRPLGVVVLRIDPAIYLYPLIKFWPSPSASAETLLVRREGNDVLFLNELRFGDYAALDLRLPLTGKTRLPAVKAVLGLQGIVDGLDYRGTPVIAAVRAVPDSPWYMVNRIDTAEGFAPLRERMWLIFMLVSVLLCSMGTVLILLWRQQKTTFYRRQFELTSALQENAERLNIIATSAQDAIIMLDEAGNIVFWNKAAGRIFGYAREEVIGRPLHVMLIPQPARESFFQAFPHFQKTGQGEAVGKTLELTGVRKDGSDCLLEVSISAVQVKGVWQSIGILRDITGRKQADEKLHLAASVFTHAHEGILITTADGLIIDVNQALCEISGYSRDELLGRNPRILSSGRQETEFYAGMWRDLIELGHWHGEFWNRRKNGEVYAVMPTISAVRDEHGKTLRYVALYTDITRLKENEQKLERSAHFDMLTNLPNRVLLADRLQQGMVQARRREQRLAVAFLDLDGFKSINDNFGHEAGDQLLITLSVQMKQALREGDTLARLGGDEFVAVMVDMGSIETSLPMLTRLLTAAAEPVQLGEITLQVSASLGVTFYPQAEDIDADQLLRQADQAMYQAKQAGKNRYHLFDAELDSRVRSRYESLERIRRALNANEFVLFYQPKVNMRTGTVIGAEALIRWQHPEKGLLLPEQFLPVVEDHLLSIDLGEWVIDTVFAQMESWQAAGLNIPVSINVGVRHLQQADFVERLLTLLEAHPNVNPENVELEVLETHAMEDLFKASQVIDACRKIGVTFSLDDFGTGYSSLSYLKHLPVTQLKIDRSFVHDMIDNPDDLSIVEGVIGLATAFRLLVIAEGAETIEHSTILLQLGCNQIQGYGIARPMPAEQLPGWEAAWRPDPVWSAFPSTGHDDLPLLFAIVEHRAWILAMEKYLKGEREDMPPQDVHQCRFGQWLNADGLARFGAQPSFQVIEHLHRKVHALATELCNLHVQDRKPEALARLKELHGLRDALLEQLRLAQQSRQ